MCFFPCHYIFLASNPIGHVSILIKWQMSSQLPTFHIFRSQIRFTWWIAKWGGDSANINIPIHSESVRLDLRLEIQPKLHWTLKTTPQWLNGQLLSGGTSRRSGARSTLMSADHSRCRGQSLIRIQLYINCMRNLTIYIIYMIYKLQPMHINIYILNEIS